MSEHNEHSFPEIIKSLTQAKQVGYYIIHLKRSTDRIPVIQQLEHSLQMTLPIFDAADGYELVKNGHPTTCQARGAPFYRRPGEIGCTVSHINICRDALSKNLDYAVVFEDDCIFRSDLSTLHSEIDKFVKLRKQWDLFLLGRSPGTTQPMEGTNISKVYQFDLAHALVMSSDFMRCVVRMYEKYTENNTSMAIDGMYSTVITQHYFNAYGFRYGNQFFQQMPGMYSYIIEQLRTNMD
jgi:GR25 family glycosyltransferase involved in LPS biosynthesis